MMEQIALVYPFGHGDLLDMDLEQLAWWAASAEQRLKESMLK